MSSSTNPFFFSRMFFMKDIYDRGLAIAIGAPYSPIGEFSTDILSAITAMDKAFDADGKPDYDLHIWMGLSRLMIGVGDVIVAAVQVDVDRPEEGPAMKWTFSLDLEGHPAAKKLPALLAQTSMFDNAHQRQCEGAMISSPFLTLTRLFNVDDRTADDVSDYLKPNQFDVPFKAMGPVDPNHYINKLGAYPLMVHPKFPARAIANIHYVLMMYLSKTGLLVREHWIPEDTSRGHARYHLTDGIEHYVLDYKAPALLAIVASIDKVEKHGEADGGLILEALEAMDEQEPNNDLEETDLP